MEPTGRKWGKESITPPILRWGTEEWSDLGRSLGEFLGTGYQSERNKVVGVDRIFRGMTLYPDIWWRVNLTFQYKSNYGALICQSCLPWSILDVLITPFCWGCHKQWLQEILWNSLLSSRLPILSLFFSKLTVLTFLQLHINCFSS